MSYSPHCWHCTHPDAWSVTCLTLATLLFVSYFGVLRVAELIAGVVLVNVVLYANLAPLLGRAFPLIERAG